MKIAVFLPNWLGDFAMATPVLRSLRGHYGPDAHIIGIMRPYLKDVLDGVDWVNECWSYNPRGRNWHVGMLNIARRLRAERVDLTLLLTNSMRTAIVAWLGGAKRSVGYSRNARRLLLTDPVSPPRTGLRVSPEPVVDAYLKLTEHLGCTGQSRRLELHTTEENRRSADGVFERLGIRRDGRIVLVNSSGAYGGSKLWPIGHFAQLCQWIVDRLDHDVLICCGPGEREIARQIAKLSERENVFHMADQPMDLGTAKAVIQRGRVMISTDSGPRHIAAAMGVPVVTLFGPVLPIFSENPTQTASHVYLDIPCRGCRGRVCPRGHHRCMRELSVDAVFSATLDLIGRTETMVCAARSHRSYELRGGMLPGQIEFASCEAATGALPVPAGGSSNGAVMTSGGPRHFPVPVAEDPAGTGLIGGDDNTVWIDRRFLPVLESEGLAEMDALMGESRGECLRRLSDRENRYLRLAESPAPVGMYLKKHFGESPDRRKNRGNEATKSLGSAAQTEAANLGALVANGIKVARLIGYGQRVDENGRIESFVLTEELSGFEELQEYVRRRFPVRAIHASRPGDGSLRKLIREVARVIRRFHAAGFNHRDLYCCHLFVRQRDDGEFDVAMIDFQRAQQRQRRRRRWIVKDLAQLAWSAPRDRISCTDKLTFILAYLEVDRIGPAEKRMIREILMKQGQMQRRLGVDV